MWLAVPNTCQIQDLSGGPLGGVNGDRGQRTAHVTAVVTADCLDQAWRSASLILRFASSSWPATHLA
jgi:hypothetical protein